MRLKTIIEKISVRISTREDERSCREILHANGWKWMSGDSLMEFNYSLDIPAERCAFELVPPDRVLWVINPIKPISFKEFKDKYIEYEETQD